MIFLIAGISWLAHLTHARPTSGYPTVIAQEADLVFGQRAGTSCSAWCRRRPPLILFTGGNTSFSGFPFLTSFVAEDSFLPRWMMQARPPAGVLQRDHRADRAVAWR